MQTISATDFVNNFGRRNQDVQNEIIEVTSHGRAVGYYLSPKEFSDLIELKNSESKNVSIKNNILNQREKILELALKHKAKGIYLFGSVARGEDNAESDIDLIVDFPEIYDLLRDRLALANALEDLLGRKVDLIVQNEIEKEILISALRDAIKL